ncbi:MAG: hypothetical protein WB868_14370 [Xanthobacteraceae bacterium]
MSAQISRPIGLLVFSSALLACGTLAVPNTAFAADCLTAPNSSTPANGHWYYRTDRVQQRKCWYLGADNQNSAHRSLPATGGAALTHQSQPAPASPYSLESFKQFITQKTGTTPSDQDVERLYAEFLEWNRRVKN